jgi:AmiR/NasT family two-component response regulator
MAGEESPVELLAGALATIADLRAALLTNRTIGMAMGILMERHQLDATRAFEVLTRISQQSNRRVAGLATELVDTRRIPLGVPEAGSSA